MLVCTVYLISKKMAALSNLNFVIIGEEDRMIDTGFERQDNDFLHSIS